MLPTDLSKPLFVQGNLFSDCHLLAAPFLPASERLVDKSAVAISCSATIDTRYSPAASSLSNFARIGLQCSWKCSRLGAFASRHNLPMSTGRHPGGWLPALAMISRKYQS